MLKKNELLQILSGPDPYQFFRSLCDSGDLVSFNPDLARGIDCHQNEWHTDTVWEHNLLTLNAAVLQSDNPLFRLAALTHDIAKPHTKEITCDGRCTFHKHDVVGAMITWDWMKSLGFDKRDIRYVSKLIRYHLWHFEDNSSDKTIRKWLLEVGQDWRDLIDLRLCDRMGNRTKNVWITEEMINFNRRIEGLIQTGKPIFREDINITWQELRDIGVDNLDSYYSNVLGRTWVDPEKNNPDWLKEFAKKYVA